jgi:tyrosyl-tRNA synthetase
MSYTFRDEISHVLTDNVLESIETADFRHKIENKCSINVFWGIEPVKFPCIDMIIPLIKIKQLTQIGLHVNILIADMHAFLNKTPQTLDYTEEYTVYYMFLIPMILDILGADKKKYIIHRGSSSQIDHRYIIDLYKLISSVSLTDARNAFKPLLARNTKFGKATSMVSSAVYPLMQILDETVFNTDLHIGSIDNKKIYELSLKHVENIGYRKCNYLMLPYLPALNGSDIKMKHVIPTDQILFDDDLVNIEKKIKSSFSTEGCTDEKKTPILFIAKYILYPSNTPCGEYHTYTQLKRAWDRKDVSSETLKELITTSLNDLLEPIRKNIKTYQKNV